MLTTDRKYRLRRYLILGVIVLVACGLALPDIPGAQPSKAQSVFADSQSTSPISYPTPATASVSNGSFTATTIAEGATDLVVPKVDLPDEAFDQKAGSVLVYNFYTNGAISGSTQDTRINITNTSATSGAFVHLYFVAEGCSIADIYICLTATQTASFLGSDVDPGITGYVVAIAYAIDWDGKFRFFDWLKGEALVIGGRAAWLRAEPITFYEAHIPKEVPPLPPTPFSGTSLVILAASHSKDDIPKHRATLPQARLSYLQSTQQSLPFEPLWSSQTGMVSGLTRNLFARSSLHGSDADGAEVPRSLRQA